MSPEPASGRLRKFDLQGDNQEGITLIPDWGANQSRLFVSEDSQAVWRYELYPAVCVGPPEVPGLSRTGAGTVIGLIIAASIAVLRMSPAPGRTGRFARKSP
jgi:hypothetical protein